MANLSLTHLVRKPLQDATGKPPVLFLLHGVGSNERDLFSLASYLDPRFLIVSLRARLALGPDAFGWYPVNFTENGPIADEGPAEESAQVLVRFIEEAVAEYDADPERVYIMGFSQGAAMSLYASLMRPDLFAGVIPMSGRLISAAHENRAGDDALKHLKFFVVHGTRDNVLPIENGQEIRDKLSALPVDLTYTEYEMAHQINEDSLREISEWLTRELGD